MAVEREGGDVRQREPAREAVAQAESAGQLALFATAPHPVVERLADLDVNTVTPMQALALLDELSRQAKTS